MKKKIVFLALLVFIVFRVLYLDRDLPPYDTTGYGQKDEQAYNFTALNLYHFNALSKPIDEPYRIQGSIKFILNNAFTYASLLLLGNNYYGLRGGAVLASVLVFLLVFHLLGLERLAVPAGRKRYIQFILGAALALNFGFLVAGRNAAPTMFRCFYMMLAMAYLVHLAKKPWPKQRLHFVLLGIFCSLLVLFSYLTNAFILAAVLLFIVGKGFAEREIKKTLVAIALLLAGVVIGLALANWRYIAFNGFGVADSVSSMAAVYSARVVHVQRHSDILSSLWTLVRTGISKELYLFSSNLFTLNFTFLFLVVVSCANALVFAFKRKIKDHVQLAAVSFICAYALQAFFYNPDSSKWVVLMFPVFLIGAVSHFADFIETGKLSSLPGKDVWFGLGFTCLACGLIVFRILYVGFNRELQALIIVSFFILIAALAIAFGKNAVLKQKALPIVLALSILPNAFLSVKYCMANPEFHYRDACIALDRIVGDRNMAGVWSDGFRLYTRGNVFFPWYQVQNRERHALGLTDIFTRKLADFTVDFPYGDFFDPERDIERRGNNFRLEKVASLYLGKGTLGQSISVYQRIDKFNQNDEGGKQ